jgi:hypothetical protein
VTDDALPRRVDSGLRAGAARDVDGDAPTQLPDSGSAPSVTLVGADAGPRYVELPNTHRVLDDREVVDAHDPRLGRVICLHRSLTPLDPTQAHAFLRGAQVAARLDHPGAPCVLALGHAADGRAFYATLRRPSVSFLGWSRGGGTDPRPTLGRRLTAMAEVCRVIGHAHRHGVIHGHLVASAIEIGEIGEVTVGDWHLATRAPDEPGAAGPAGAAVTARDDVLALLALLAAVLGDDHHAVPELGLLASEPGGLGAITSADDITRAIDRFLDGERNPELRARAALRHVELAHAAVARGRIGFATALIEARRALALDPADARAAAIVGRLMVEVPEPLPPSARRAIEHSDQQVIRDMGIGVIAAFSAFLAYVGIMLVQGVRSPGTVIAIAAMTAIMLRWAIRWRVAGPHVFSWPAMLGTAAVLTLYTRTMGPFINAPAQAALATLAVSFFPRAPRPGAILATFAVPVLGTYGLELAGLLAPTTTVTDGELRIHSEVVQLDETQTFVGLVFVTIVLVTVAASMAGRVASSHARNVRALLVQRWKIREIAGGVVDDREAAPSRRTTAPIV